MRPEVENFMARVLVIANKDFEVQPLLGLLASRKVRPKALPAPTSIELMDPQRSSELPPGWRTPRIARECAGVFDEEEAATGIRAASTALVHA